MSDTQIIYMVLLFVLMVFALMMLAKAARIVKQYEKGLIMRLGKYHAMTPSGLTFIVPLVDDRQNPVFLPNLRRQGFPGDRCLQGAGPA